ncbi:MAG: CPBP family intramembrane glutamic endopeptidase [Ktedonobacteraceae bacterium]
MMRNLFFAADGRIALFWRLFLAFVGTLLIYLIFDLAAGFFLYLGLHINYSYLSNVYSPAYNTDLRVVSCYSVAYVLIAVVTVWFLRWFRRHVDRRSPAGLAWTGLGGHWRGILLGAVLGAAVPLLAVWIGSAWGLFNLHIAQLSWSGLVIVILFNVIQYTATGIREETYYRGYVFQNLGERMALWLNVVCVGVFFILGHLLNGLAYVSPSFAVGAMLASTIWICGRLLTRSLWFSIGMHAAGDSASFLIGILLFSGLGLNTAGTSLRWLEAPFLVLILLVLVGWTIWGKQRINWNARLTERGEPTGQTPSLPEEVAVAAPIDIHMRQK